MVNMLCHLMLSSELLNPVHNKIKWNTVMFTSPLAGDRNLLNLTCRTPPPDPHPCS